MGTAIHCVLQDPSQGSPDPAAWAQQGPSERHCSLPAIIAWHISKDKPVNYSCKEKAAAANDPVQFGAQLGAEAENGSINARGRWEGTPRISGQQQQLPHGTWRDAGARITQGYLTEMGGCRCRNQQGIWEL